MTRARQTLTLARLDIGNPLVDRLPDNPALLRRPAGELLPEPDSLDRRYIIPALREIDLGFAGRNDAQARIHSRIAALKVGDSLQLLTEPRGYTLQATDGFAVGRLSQHFNPPGQLRCVAARVHAVVVWRKRDSSSDYVERCKCDRWEVLVPELVFAP